MDCDLKPMDVVLYEVQKVHSVPHLLAKSFHKLLLHRSEWEYSRHEKKNYLRDDVDVEEHHLVEKPHHVVVLVGDIAAPIVNVKIYHLKLAELDHYKVCYHLDEL